MYAVAVILLYSMLNPRFITRSNKSHNFSTTTEDTTSLDTYSFVKMNERAYDKMLHFDLIIFRYALGI